MGCKDDSFFSVPSNCAVLLKSARSSWQCSQPSDGTSRLGKHGLPGGILLHSYIEAMAHRNS